MSLDPTTDIGKVRLRVADWTDIPFLPDEVYRTTIDEASGNLPAAAQTIATYILGMLSLRTHKKMVQLEIWGAESYKNYKDYLVSTISSPSLMSYTALPVLITGDGVENPLAQFTNDWNKTWSNPENVTEMVHRLANGESAQPWDNI